MASDVVIDFTHAHAAPGHAAAAARAGKPLILGSSGLSAEEEEAVAEAARTLAPIVYAANFAPGVNLMFAIAERMAAALPAESYDAEIVEMHHRQKVDAPSGTAVALGRAVARGRGTPHGDGFSGRDGHTGPRKHRHHRLRRASRWPGGGGAHADLRGLRRAYLAGTSQLRPRRLCGGGGPGGDAGRRGKPAGLYDMKDVLGMG